MNIVKNILNNTGLILILILYILSGIGKINNFDKTSKILMKKFLIKLNLIFFKLIIIGVIILLIGGSSFLIYANFTKKFNLIRKIILSALIIFTILATLLYHYPPVGADKYHFLKNLSITGAFTYALSNLF